MQAVDNGLRNSALKLFHTLLTNPFVNEKPPLQIKLITAARRTIHQAKEPCKLHIFLLLNLRFLVSWLKQSPALPNRTRRRNLFIGRRKLRGERREFKGGRCLYNERRDGEGKKKKKSPLNLYS